MLTPAQLFTLCDEISHVEVTDADRKQMAVGLFLQGYTAGRACHIAFVELDDGDGALQMLARHRIASSLAADPKGCPTPGACSCVPA